VSFLRDALALYYCARDPRTPARAKAIAFAALAYFIMPIDLVPDTIPVIGMLDDGSVVAFALWALDQHVTEDHRRKADQLLKDLLGGKKPPAGAGASTPKPRRWRSGAKKRRSPSYRRQR
jgi:uncharacterized membrane protein YkvA (DUF1232 family)